MDTILFDLDGTLLPMDQQEFMKLYFGELSKKCAAHGFDPAPIPGAVWSGTKAMMQNDGSATNENAFWAVFADILGEEVLRLKPVLEKFYVEEFENTRAATSPNPLAAPLIQALKHKGYTLVLASNPLFPAGAYRTRLGWIGLAPEDFDLISPYETFHHCKPNARYYHEVLRKIGKTPEQCLMVGNDVEEDGCAKTLGMDFYLITDNLINGKNEDLSHYKSAAFREFYQHAQAAL